MSGKYNIPKEFRNEFTPEELQQHRTHFKGYDNETGTVPNKDVQALVKSMGKNLKKKEIADLMAQCEIDPTSGINFQQFLSMGAAQKGESGHGHEIVDGHMHVKAATSGAKHMISLEETAAFSRHMNQRLADDKDLKHIMPLNPDSMDLYHAVRDGLLLIKMINLAVPETIDVRAVNFPAQKKNKELSIFEMRENNNLVIESCKAIGCKVVGVHNQSLIEGTRCPHLVLGLVWQIVKIELMSTINLKNHPELYLLLKDGEELSKLLGLTPEQILIRWVNYHMGEAGCKRELKRKTFVKEIKDCEIYTVLLNRLGDIDGKPTDLKAMEFDKKAKRAPHVMRNARALGVAPMLAERDITSGNKKLNYAFLAQIFNDCPGLTITEEQAMEAAELLDEDGAGTREERVYRMWINSLNIDDLYVTNMYEDGRNGLMWLKIIDRIQEGVVPWDRVNKKKNKMNVYKRGENCSLAVKLMKEAFKFSLVGVGGSDLEKGYKKLCLACMWQLMRLYTVNLLCQLGGGKKITDKKIVEWANNKVKCSGAASNNNDKANHKMKSFRDSSLGNGLFLMDLVFAMEPRSVNWEIVTAGESDEDKEMNAKYVISVARKLGAAIFVTFEDIVEVNPKMVMLVTASLMAVDLGFNEDEGAAEEVLLDEDEDVVKERAHRRSVARGKSMILEDDEVEGEEAK